MAVKVLEDEELFLLIDEICDNIKKEIINANRLGDLEIILQKYNVSVAYNLDGGGSSVMVFNNKIVNKPTTDGRIRERGVSDIVYIGY